MYRVRRTRKSPSPSDDSSSSHAVARPSFSLLSSGAGGSPILSHRGSVSGGGGASYAMYGRTAQSLLQSVIRDLVDSEDDQERRTQRMKLESDLEMTSERLDDLVQEHRDKLHGTLKTFDAVDAKIKDSQEKIARVKASLKSCKSLLRCKREELKRLWLEDVKYKHMLQMVDSIEEVRSVPEKLTKFKASKHYLQATELLKNSVARLEGELASVEALKELKYELIQQKQNLHEELIDELHRHLYVKAPLHHKHHHARNVSDGTGTTAPSRKAATLTRGTPAAAPPRLEASVEGSGQGQSEDVVSEVELGSVDPERDSHRYMAVLVEALSILGKVQEALDAIHQRMEKEFLLIIEKASIQVTRTRDQEEGQGGRRGRVVVRENMPKQLTKMLKLCFERFRGVVSAHEVLLSHFQRTKRTYKAPYTLYKISDVWVAIQRVVQSALEVYLAYDEESTPTDMGAGYAAFASPGDAHSMFSRRKPASARVTKKPLFRFDSSRHALSINSYMREQRDLELTGAEGTTEPVAPHHYEQDQPSIAQHLVCKPHNRNITVVFRDVRNFIEEIEEALSLDQLHCQLHLFLDEYVERDFLERVRLEYFDKMSSCAKPEAAKSTAPDQKTLKVTGSKLCVLNSALTVWQLVVELRQLMKDLPLYSSHFLAILCELLVGYKESLQILYKGLTTVPVEAAVGGKGVAVGGASITQEGVISSKWAKEEEITTAIKSLSTWVKAKQNAKVKGDDERVQTVYSKESELLTRHLVEPLRKHNVILSHDNLRLLAIFHESVDWFSGRLKQVVLELTSEERGRSSPQESTDGSAMSSPLPSQHLTLSEDVELLEQFSSVQLELQGLAETAIIMLHLEVRCHCFYFLWPAVQRPSYIYEADGVEEDDHVRRLAADLKNVDLVMVAVLSQDKYRYLFEGVGHLVAAIFISSTNYIKTINSNGIKKMCRNIQVLQSCLSKITLIRERELDRARKYFEMLYLNFDELTEGLLEHGAMYSLDDYKRALTLLTHSNLKGEGVTSEEASKRLEQQHQQLDAIFSRDTV